MGLEATSWYEIFSMKIYLADNVWIIDRERTILKRILHYNILRSFYYLMREKRSIKETVKLITK